MERLVLTEETDFLLTMTDCLRAGHCVPGVRAWFASRELSIRAFVREGMSAKALLETGDGFARQVVTRAWARRQAENASG